MPVTDDDASLAARILHEDRVSPTVSYRTPSGTWTHRPTDRDAENRRLARRWDRAVHVLALLDQADTAAATKPTYANRDRAADRHHYFDQVLAALNLTDAEHAQALAAARAEVAR